MKITESHLRQIIREELEMDGKSPGWVPPPLGWEWNDRSRAYTGKNATVFWDPHMRGHMGPDGRYTAGTWAVSVGDGEWGNVPVRSPEEGFAESEMP